MSLMSLIVLCTEPRGNGSRQFWPAQHRFKAVARGSPRFIGSSRVPYLVLSLPQPALGPLIVEAGRFH